MDFKGKSIIHPSQINLVNKSYIVSYSDYKDACNILNTDGTGGVFKSKDGNRMNEVKPHTTWAKRIWHEQKFLELQDKTAERNLKCAN